MAKGKPEGQGEAGTEKHEPLSAVSYQELNEYWASIKRELKKKGKGKVKFNSLLHDTHFSFVQEDQGFWKVIGGDKLCPSVKVSTSLNKRREALVAEWRKRAGCRALSFEATTTSRFVTGMGLPHPKENGFSWMRPYGVPYIPGSSLKGMLRAWLESDWCEWDGCPFDKLFGTAGHMGEMVFMDVIPLGDAKELENKRKEQARQKQEGKLAKEPDTMPLRFAMDVMTPHYGPYYGASDDDLENNPPADWYDPVPIQFLTVEAGQTFRIDLLLPPQEEDLGGDLKRELEEGLKLYGIGAKTSSGFGRFELKKIEGKAT
jgi:CRISPR type III-B/RAMP module RAMP protein Cmr6